MSVRKLKPITPGQRFRVVNSFDAITTEWPGALVALLSEKTQELNAVRK